MLRHLSFAAVGNDGTIKVAVEGNLSDEAHGMLEAYLESADRLHALQVARDGVPASLEIKIVDGQLAHVESTLPCEDDLAALLHRLRPFILTSEPASFDRVAGVVARCLEHAYVRGYLKELRHLYDGKTSQAVYKVSSNGVVINCEKTLQDWLNGYEYHRDGDKRERLAQLHRLMPLESSMPIFMELLGCKVSAILRLADFVAVLLGRQSEIQVQRQMRIEGVDT